MTATAASVANYQTSLGGDSNVFKSHLKHFLLLENLSLLTALPCLLNLHTAGISLKRLGLIITDKFLEIRKSVVTSALLSLNSLTVFQEYYNCIITVTTGMNNKNISVFTWSANILDLAFSAFFLWMNSMRTLLFLNTLPLAFR